MSFSRGIKKFGHSLLGLFRVPEPLHGPRCLVCKEVLDAQYRCTAIKCPMWLDEEAERTLKHRILACNNFSQNHQDTICPVSTSYHSTDPTHAPPIPPRNIKRFSRAAQKISLLGLPSPAQNPAEAPPIPPRNIKRLNRAAEKDSLLGLPSPAQNPFPRLQPVAFSQPEMMVLCMLCGNRLNPRAQCVTMNCGYSVHGGSRRSSSQTPTIDEGWEEKDGMGNDLKPCPLYVVKRLSQLSQ